MEISATRAFKELAELRRKDKATRKTYKDYVSKPQKFNPALYAPKGAKVPVENPR